MTRQPIRHHLALVLAAATSLAAVARSQDPARPPLPAAATLLDRHVEATGGKKAHLAVKTRKWTGKLRIDMAGHKIEARVVKQLETPDLSHTVIDSAELSQVIVTNGPHAWEWSRGHDGEGRTRLLEGELRQRRLDAAALHAEVEWREHLAKVETTGGVTRDGAPAWSVAVTTKDGRKLTRFYDKASGRFVGYRQAIELHGGDGDMDVAIGGYEEVDGVRLPMRVVVTLNSPKYGRGTQTWVWSKVEHGREMPARLFAMPPEVREQVEAKEKKGKAKTGGAVRADDKR